MKTDPALDPRSEVVGAITTAFPQADHTAIVKAIRILRQSNQKNKGA